MKPRNHGTIIRVGSALAFRGIPLQTAYCGAKAAIENFSEALRVELKHQKSSVHLCQVHMPGVNTPQFDWVLHRGIDHHPMPVPPVYQPEVAARAIAHVAEHPRRSMWVGLPPVLTILGNRLAPSLPDRYLARTNVKGQQSPQDDPAGQQPNTWEPVYGDDVAAHGSFDGQAHSHSPQFWTSEHRRAIAATAAGIGIAAAAAPRGRASTPASGCGAGSTVRHLAAVSDETDGQIVITGPPIVVGGGRPTGCHARAERTQPRRPPLPRERPAPGAC